MGESAALRAPTTALARAAADLAAEASPSFLLHHSYRTYRFGRLILGEADVDEEAAFVASMIHDLGLTEAFRGARSFELVGAELAAKFLEARGWEPARIRAVEQAIIRHTELAPEQDPAARVVQAGAAFDVAGLPPELLEHEGVREILAEQPRQGFVDGILALYFEEIRRQPDGVFARLEKTVALSERIRDNPLRPR